ncbi:hypothetical protein LEP1GSC187_1594 [Leptospira santarosai str. ZUN179]|uniref:Uncharacterized protein n=1 Tax=Leptospira santarosai str. ZUN179 TaxID=1049985 RepID=M6UVX9_9LEPT|nr:hypothetical protein LEP1GSC187_1594 [Leptospira santarosai str. ZUN179]
MEILAKFGTEKTGYYTNRLIEDALEIVYHKAIKKSARDPKALRSLRDFFSESFRQLEGAL